MKVLVATNMAPFVWGGAEELASELRRQLERHGHRAELLRLPFQWNPAERIPSQMLMARMLELSNVDHVIGLKFPAYLIRHPRKSLWLVHQYRQAYDLFEAGLSNISADADGSELREAIRAADDQAVGESRGVYVISPVVGDRLRRFNAAESVVLRPPIINPEMFVGGDAGDYILAAGRINALKRQHLLVEAVAKCDRPVRLVIAGPPDTPDDAERIEAAVREFDVADRVVLDLRLLDRHEYADYVNHAIAVAYVPYDEDSFGYVSVEAAEAGKPVITTTDSGGVLGLVNAETGWVVEPEPDGVASAMSQAWSQRARAAELGAAARHFWHSFEVNWETTIDWLLR